SFRCRDRLEALALKLIDGAFSGQHGIVTGDLGESLLPVPLFPTLVLTAVPVRRLKGVNVEAELPHRTVAVEQMVEQDRQNFLVGIRQSPSAVVPHVPIAGLASF